MFFLTFANVWSFAYFFFFSYMSFLVIFVIYTLPALTQHTKYSLGSKRSVSDIVSGLDVTYVVCLPYLLFLALNLLWSAPTFSAWFGHLYVSSLQSKISMFYIPYFMLILYVIFNSTYFTSREIYDYVATLVAFGYWLLLLFYVNSLFTTIFVIEVLSALIFLLLVTSTFSSAYFYRNLNLSYGHIFQHSTPHTHLNSIIFFFWMSLIASLNLFLFLIILYTKLATMDWFLMEYVMIYIVNVGSFYDLAFVGTSWFVFMSSLFIKCGIAPFYLWKPTFFKGLPFPTLFFYICFFLFLFIPILYLFIKRVHGRII